MLHLLIHKINHQDFDRGFTLVEILTTLLLFGILCALGTPSILAMQGVAKLNSSLDNIRTALETSQFEAIKKNQSCTVYFPTTVYTANRSGQVVGNCLMNGNGTSSSLSGIIDGLTLFYLDKGITVSTSNSTGTPAQVVYNSKGLTQSAGTTDVFATIIVSSDETSEKRCLKVNKGVGLIRSGRYIATNTPPCELIE
jgi:prepilin-type N-terminal cleavage/methylation domain-containing protein